MSELKTLKDLRDIDEASINQEKINLKELFGSSLVPKEDVKQEAIKWIKQDMAWNAPSEMGSASGAFTKQGMIEVWMRRLNITSEDLK